ncbi:MAG TPA: BlaI/MecI/CopY family transcriptional regulator [Pirellulales bacterium]|jgi:predicted transcriptional regulator|nr:BlaI/MecI/CopY family transcriptional regulator [Pirellulales bacterium]
MAKERTELTKLEWVLMDALWEAGQATAVDLQRKLEKSQGWAYSTVKTMLDRLVEMGQVKARRVGNVYEYSPKSKRPTVVGRAVDEMTERLFDGSVAPFIECLLQRGKLTPEQVAELQRMLDQFGDEKESSS